jgi:hypothetical protein
MYWDKTVTRTELHHGFTGMTDWPIIFSVKLKYLISHNPIICKSAQAPSKHISPGKPMHTKQPKQNSSNIKLTMET